MRKLRFLLSNTRRSRDNFSRENEQKHAAIYWVYRDSSLQVKGQGGDEEDPNGSDPVQLFSEADEVKEFFEILDGELNKVNDFYVTKESEFLERGEMLKKQLQILVDFKQVLDESRRKGFSAISNSSNRSPDFSGTSFVWTDNAVTVIIVAIRSAWLSAQANDFL